MNLKTIFWTDIAVILFNLFSFYFNIWILCASLQIDAFSLFIMELNIIAIFAVVWGFRECCNVEEKMRLKRMYQNGIDTLRRQFNDAQLLNPNETNKKKEAEERDIKEAEKIRPQTNSAVQFIELEDTK